ncbi:NADPH-dependent oxidoreductase [Geobacillus sp. MR]|jgi:FMN reductase/FAD reductase [NAD(P)H]|uniref:NADPH-dependent FMN reductase n=1 Tax=Geobacillus sp. MR TaxID=2508875 RepID=UPI00148B8977|nr:NAD(P)H-dependent oxidoreductase [Geobacillus sp. MR]NNU88093.1 NADPH-dependent oxidoreductase [Geobacillus sp. MR]
MKVLGISGTIVGSKTAILVNRVLKEIKEISPQSEVTLLDLRDYNMEFCDGRKTELYNADTQKIIELVSLADAFVIGFPVFNCSMPAPLKNVFDLVSPDVFRNKVMGFIANGGTYQHYLVIENQLKPIAGYFRAYVAPNYVYAHTDHFNSNNEIQDADVVRRIKDLAHEIVHMYKGLEVKINHVL